jgi:GAF domain-containing protein
VTAADVRDWDPGEGSISTPEAVPAPARPGDPPASGTVPPAQPSGACTPAGEDSARFAALWAQATDHFREGMVICDSAGVVRHVNAVARTLLPGLAVGEVIASSGLAVFSEAPETTAAGVDVTYGGRRLLVRRVPLTYHCAWYVEDVTEASGRADALLAERSRSQFLVAASQKLGNPLHADRAARAAARMAVPTLGDVAVLVLAVRGGRVRWWRATVGDDGDAPVVDGGTTPAPELPPVIAEALAGGEPHTADWLVEQLAEADWLAGLAPSQTSARVVSLPGSGAPTGALVVARSAGRPFDEPDLQMLRGFAARAGAALNAAMLYRDQAEIAETLQASLLPVAPAPVAGLGWGTAYRPAQAALRIGGDFYGTHQLPDGRSIFFLGDVSGKGVEAAVFTGQLRQGLQALRRVEQHPRPLLSLLNDAVLETTQAHGLGRFATMVLGLAAPVRDGGLELTLASGGHLPPLVLRNDGTVEPVALRGMLIGVVADPRIDQTTVRLAPGETCLLYSDGVTEARGGRRGNEQFGVDRLTRALTGCHRMPAAALAERVEQVVCDWLAGRDHDDIAVLAVQAEPAGGRRRGARHLHAVPDPGQAGTNGGTA